MSEKQRKEKSIDVPLAVVVYVMPGPADAIGNAAFAQGCSQCLVAAPIGASRHAHYISASVALVVSGLRAHLDAFLVCCSSDGQNIRKRLAYVNTPISSHWRAA